VYNFSYHDSGCHIFCCGRLEQLAVKGHHAREPTMNKPSERIVVFVSTAQKRAITSIADGLGISVSELMRRAVQNFGATSEQVKAASIVDRLRAPREPDALNAALQRVARTTQRARAAAQRDAPDAIAGQVDPEAATTSTETSGQAATHPTSPFVQPADSGPVSATVSAAVSAPAPAAASIPALAPVSAPAAAAPGPAPAPSSGRRSRVDARRDTDDPQVDPADGDSRFA
jgi:predicted transcriptional regulator